MAVVTMKSLLEAGVHFGHQTRSWNPKMAKYIFTARNGVHIINLENTVVEIEKAYAFVMNTIKDRKDATVLFVGTKKQAHEAIKSEATRCGMYYINERWLGGLLTNFKTIKTRIDRLNSINAREQSGELSLLTKKEAAQLIKERDVLEQNLGGIKNMTRLPDIIFVIDIEKEHLAVEEARKLHIPIVALVDTKCDPDLVDYVIPGNDDAIRAVKLITATIANAVIEGRDGVQFEVSDEDEEEVEEGEEEVVAEEPAE
jgi:small subunit ribosomal protein S2